MNPIVAPTGAVGVFKDLVSWVLIIPKLVKVNEIQRRQIRGAVGSVADELRRGLDLVEQRIHASKTIAQSASKHRQRELVAYLAQSRGKLFESFSEFKICRGLREKRDQFKQVFHPARMAVRRENMKTVAQLLQDLENDERMIIDEVGPLLEDLRRAAAQPPSKFVVLADEKIGQIASRRTRIRQLARQVHDRL